MKKSDKKFKEARRRSLHKTTDKIPLTLTHDRHIIKAVEPVWLNNMGKMFARYTNKSPVARSVRVSNTGIREIDFELRSYFQHIEDNKYKCLICNSTVIKKYDDGFVFFNEDGYLHRKQMRKGYFACNILKTKTKTIKTKHIGHYKPEDNSFLMIE